MKSKEEIKKRNKEWKCNNPDKLAQQRKRYRIKYRKKINEYNRKYSIGYRRLQSDTAITIKEYDELFNKQKGKCRICGRHQSVLNKRLGVDHNHITGKIRGLLCNNCNLILGHANDNVIILIEAIKYLQDTI